MKLYYCTNCGLVYLFNVYDIRKHELEPVHDKSCQCGGMFLPFGIEDLQVDDK